MSAAPHPAIPILAEAGCLRATEVAARVLLIAIATFVFAGCATPPVAQPSANQPPAQSAEQTRQAARLTSVCGAQPGTPFAFRKKVLVLSMPLARPSDATDLPDLSAVWSRALQKRLRASDRFLVRDGSAYYLDPEGDVRARVMAVAERFDAQFVVAGRIVAVGTKRAGIELGRFATLPLPFADQRVIETELQVFDGHSGAQLNQLAHDAEVSGRVESEGQRILQGDFSDTSLGKTIAGLVERQGEGVEDELACLPMQARIVQAQAKEVRIDAGFTSNLAPGDRLRIYQRRGGAEQAYGELAIKKVFPESAIGSLEGEAPDWRFNAYVRAW
jgi:hypothetical protein